jgi:hypothetical protein
MVGIACLRTCPPPRCSSCPCWCRRQCAAGGREPNKTNNKISQSIGSYEGHETIGTGISSSRTSILNLRYPVLIKLLMHLKKRVHQKFDLKNAVIVLHFWQRVNWTAKIIFIPPPPLFRTYFFHPIPRQMMRYIKFYLIPKSLTWKGTKLCHQQFFFLNCFFLAFDNLKK